MYNWSHTKYQQAAAKVPSSLIFLESMDSNKEMKISFSHFLNVARLYAIPKGSSGFGNKIVCTPTGKEYVV